jgi:hypothetical protein
MKLTPGKTYGELMAQVVKEVEDGRPIREVLESLRTKDNIDTASWIDFLRLVIGQAYGIAHATTWRGG